MIDRSRNRVGYDHDRKLQRCGSGTEGVTDRRSRAGARAEVGGGGNRAEGCVGGEPEENRKHNRSRWNRGGEASASRASVRRGNRATSVTAVGCAPRGNRQEREIDGKVADALGALEGEKPGDASKGRRE